MKLLPQEFKVDHDEFYLRPITEEDTEQVLKWRNSEFVVSQFFYRSEITREEHLNWLRNKVFVGDVYQFVVMYKDGDVPCGSCYLQHYDPDRHSMEAGVFMSPDAPKGIGLGTKAMKAVIYDVGFGVLGMDMIHAKVLSTNVASNKMHIRIGLHEASREMCKLIPDNTIVECVNYEVRREEIE